MGCKNFPQQNLFFVLRPKLCIVERYPAMGERVIVGTLPYEFKGFVGYRNFVMMDEQGRNL